MQIVKQLFGVLYLIVLRKQQLQMAYRNVQSDSIPETLAVIPVEATQTKTLYYLQRMTLANLCCLDLHGHKKMTEQIVHLLFSQL